MATESAPDLKPMMIGRMSVGNRSALDGRIDTKNHQTKFHRDRGALGLTRSFLGPDIAVVAEYWLRGIRYRGKLVHDSGRKSREPRVLHTKRRI